MMQKIVAITLLLLCTNTWAEPQNTGKYYAAAELGTASYSNKSQFPNPGVFRMAAGYYFGPYLTAEAGYSIFGDSKAGAAKLSADSLQVAAIGKFPISLEMDLTGKIGLASNSVKVSNASSGSNTSVLLGLGIQYHFDPRVSFRVQYDDYGRFESSSSPLKATTISGGITYDF